MKRLKQKQKRQVPQQNDAIKYLSLISERDTGYLEDWAKTNSIKQQDIQSSNELLRQNGHLIQNPQIKQGEYNEMKQQKPLNSNNTALLFRRKIQVKIQNFANVPQPQFCGKISKATIYEQNRYPSLTKRQILSQSKREQNCIQQANQNKKSENQSQNDSSARLNNPISMNYIQKIRRLSLPWLKNLPKLDKSEDKDFNKQIKVRQQTRRVNQIIKNKIRRKQSNKYLIHKKLSEIESVQKMSKNDEITENQNERQKSEIKLLKSWLDYNRSKKKRSISSLLSEHFENKYLQKKKLRQKAMVLKSAKAISVLSNNYQQKFH